MNETDFNKIIDSINSLTVYREIKNNKIIDILRHILTEEDNLPYMAELVATLRFCRPSAQCGGLVHQ